MSIFLETKRLIINTPELVCGEIKTAHPGNLGSQDAFYVGILKGVGHVYQQTFVDTYSKVARLHISSLPFESRIVQA